MGLSSGVWPRFKSGVSELLLTDWPWIASSVPFVGAGLFLFISAAVDKTMAIQLVSIDIAVAVFSVNIALFGFQSARYRNLHDSLATKQIFASMILLVIALAPILGFCCGVDTVARLAIGALPVIAWGALGLFAFARRETSPRMILARLASNSAMERFAKNYRQASEERFAEFEALTLSHATSPTHEWSWQVSPPASSQDPFFATYGLAVQSVRDGDVVAFQEALRTIISLYDATSRTASDDADGSHSLLHSHAQQALRQFVIEATIRDKSGAFRKKVLDELALCILDQADDPKRIESAQFALSTSVLVARYCLEDGQYEASLVPVAVGRQGAEKGLRLIRESDDIDDRMFEHQLQGYVRHIQSMGHYAVERKDSDFLYRCFDALGWLGCSSVKVDCHDVGAACLGSIVQLGRESRAAAMDCFWDRCALLPIDHAKERIDWIATWVPKVKPEGRNWWLDSLAEAYSRILGKVTKVEMDQTDGTDGSRVSLTITKEPHTLSYASSGGVGEIDYSDPQQLKQMNLW